MKGHCQNDWDNGNCYDLTGCVGCLGRMQSCVDSASMYVGVGSRGLLQGTAA